MRFLFLKKFQYLLDRLAFYGKESSFVSRWLSRVYKNSPPRFLRKPLVLRDLHKRFLAGFVPSIAQKVFYYKNQDWHWLSLYSSELVMKEPSCAFGIKKVFSVCWFVGFGFVKNLASSKFTSKSTVYIKKDFTIIFITPFYIVSSSQSLWPSLSFIKLQTNWRLMSYMSTVKFLFSRV